MVNPIGNSVKASRRRRAGVRGVTETGVVSLVGSGLYKCQSAMKPSNCKGVKLCNTSFPVRHPVSTPSLDLPLYSHLVVPEAVVDLRQLTSESNTGELTPSTGSLKSAPHAYCANSSAIECLSVRGQRWYGFTSAVDTFRVRCFLPRIVTCTLRPVCNTSVTLQGPV